MPNPDCDDKADPGGTSDDRPLQCAIRSRVQAIIAGGCPTRPSSAARRPARLLNFANMAGPLASYNVRYAALLLWRTCERAAMTVRPRTTMSRVPAQRIPFSAAARYATHSPNWVTVSREVLPLRAKVPVSRESRAWRCGWPADSRESKGSCQTWRRFQAWPRRPSAAQCALMTRALGQRSLAGVGV